MGHGHDEALVSTAWLAEHLDDPAIRIVDASFTLPGVKPTGRDNFRAGHIPGAVYFDIDEISDHSTSLPHMLPKPEEFATAMAKLGVGDVHRVVAYEVGSLSTAARAWWMLRAFGHDDVAVLDGGLAKWAAEGRPVTTEIPKLASARFTTRFNSALVRNKAQIFDNLTSECDQVLDARAAERFAGTAPEPWPGRRSGHIPGSLSLPYTRLVDPATKTVLPAEKLAAAFRDAGVGADRPVVCSCGSGVTACALALGLYLIGREDVAIYDGSWAEWGLPGNTPIATGAPRHRP